MAGGVTCSGKALVSQCAPEAPIGVTFRQKALRYKRTAQSVLYRAEWLQRAATGRLAMALTILAAMTWAVAQPSLSLIYQPQLPLLY